MDMLSADMQLSCNSTLPKRGKSANAHLDDTHVSFHFIAFVPIEGQIWKLDGLERQPQKLCTIEEEEEWIYQTKPQIEALMAEYEEDQIEFSILSLVKAPLSGLISALAQNVRGLSTLSTYAETTEANTRLSTGSFVDAGGNGLGCIVSGPDPIYGLTQDIINQAVILPAVQDAIQSRDELRVAQLWRDLTVAQAGLRASIREEQLCDQSDQERADGRRFDYGPSIHNVIRSLARKRFFTSENV
jgi:ubiquitin carboxyl-terminal hydrolase L5